MTGTGIPVIILTSSVRFWDSSSDFYLEAFGISVALVVSTSSDRFLIQSSSAASSDSYRTLSSSSEPKDRHCH